MPSNRVVLALLLLASSALAPPARALTCQESCNANFYTCIQLTCGGSQICPSCSQPLQSCLNACPCTTCPTPGDADGDSLADSLEDQLAVRWAPLVFLHSHDEFQPSNAEFYMARVEMKYHHGGLICPDHRVLGLGQVTNSTIASQQHAEASTFLGVCTGHNSTVYSSGNGTLSPTSFYLEVPDDIAGWKDATYAGRIFGSRCYAHVRKAPGSAGQIDVQYWFFYPRNGAASFNGSTNVTTAGAHEGDWEHVTLRLTPDRSGIEKMYFSAHNPPEGGWRTPAQISKTADGRPIVFSAWHSHASYPTAGIQVRGGGKPDDQTDMGTIWDCATRTLNVGELVYPANGQTWLRFNGRWGELGDLGGCSVEPLCFNGPYGPAYQSRWNADPL